MRIAPHETDVFADAGYQGTAKREKSLGTPVNWHVTMRPGKRREIAGHGWAQKLDSAACLARTGKVVLQVISGTQYRYPIMHLQNPMTPTWTLAQRPCGAPLGWS